MDLDDKERSQGDPAHVEVDCYQDDGEAHTAAYSHDFGTACGAEGHEGAAAEAGGDDHDGDNDTCSLVCVCVCVSIVSIPT